MQHRLVATLDPFPGMAHLDVAGGTGDVAFRVLRALRRAEADARQRQTAPTQSQKHDMQPGGMPADTPAGSAPGQEATAQSAGSVVVFDINPEMLAAGRVKVTQQADLAGGG